MQLEPPFLLEENKITQYLLVYLPKDDKSNYLKMAGYGTENWLTLKQDLLALVAVGDAIHESTSVYGESFSITGLLVGPNGRELMVKTIWMKEKKTEFTKFITLYPP